MKLLFLFDRNRLIYSLLLIFTLGVFGCQDDPELGGPGGEDGVLNPTRAYVNGIRVNSFPATDPTGATWDVPEDSILPVDPNGLPDIMLNITDVYPEPPVYWAQESHFANVDVADSVAYTLVEPYEVAMLDSYFLINIYDYDVPDSTLMGSVTLYVGQYPDPENPYPSAVLIQENGYSVTVGLSWFE